MAKLVIRAVLKSPCPQGREGSTPSLSIHSFKNAPDASHRFNNHAHGLLGMNMFEHPGCICVIWRGYLDSVAS